MKNKLLQETGQKDVLTQFASSRTIKYLFAKFHARYGSRWHSQFPEDLWPVVQSEWLHELKNMTADDIKRGLDTWRDPWPPNVFEFSEACKLVAGEKKINSGDYQEYVSIAPINTNPEDAKKNLKNLRSAIAGTGILKTGEYYGESAIKDPDYIEAQDKLNRAMREVVDNASIKYGAQVQIKNKGL